jgi:hypothetical protein
LNTARSGHTVSVLEGFMYVMGGFDGTQYLDSIEYAPLNADGSPGSFATAIRVLPSPRADHIAIHHWQLYIIGGHDGTTYFSDINFTAPKNPGDLVEFIFNDNPILTPRAGHAGIATNHTIYIAGGDNGGVPFLDMQYAPFQEVDY